MTRRGGALTRGGGAEVAPAELYRRMAVIRAFEERCMQLASEGAIAGSVHCCFGQEAIPVGAMAALGEHDRVLCTYRGHGWALACGVPLDALLGEIAQRAGGVNGGRAGSPLLFSPEHGLLGENSIVGAGVPIAAGVAMAARAKGEDRVVLASIGDGAMNQGSVHEALVFAAGRRLPLVVVCENNGWSEMTPIASIVRVGDLAERAGAYGIAAEVVDGCDPAAVREAVARAAASARAGEGPILLECKTVRLSGHYNRDIEHYRPKADAQAARAAEPIGRLRRELTAARAASAAQLDALDAEALALVDAATAGVRAMDEPAAASAAEHVYAPARVLADADERADRAAAAETTELTYVKAVNAALRAELAERPELLVYGEDVGHAGGIFGVSRGLQQEFGAERVFDTPIAESAILGSAVGAAMEGMRPVVEIMWADFLLVALDQLFNQAANVRYVTRGALQAPLVVRTQQGVTPGSCAQHSQSVEALIAHVPGLRIGLPATPQDAYAMLRAAIAEPDPVMVVEARGLYQLKGEVALGAPLEPVAGARVRREGADVVLVTWGAMLHAVSGAAELLAEEGVEAAVVDLRWLSPLDDETIERVVRASDGKVLVVHEANVTGGFGAEVAARIQERHFDWLDAPVARLGAPDVRMPSAPALQRALLPDAQKIAQAARTLVRGARA